jgi:two-component system response regulator HydG
MRDKPLLLLIDDEQSLVESLTVLLKGEGYEVVSELTGASGVKVFKEMTPDIVLSDVRMPKMSGIEVLDEIRKTNPNAPVVLMTAQASLQSAIQAVNLGATHYIQKPFENDELLAILGRSLDWGRLKQENAGLKRELKKQQTLKAGRPIGVSPTFEVSIKLAESVADSDSTIMISGESGTGKEVFARYIHDLSPRSNRRFLSLNCGALPEGLLESELFGHVKGSFTGAVRDKEGLFVAASGGTFFLDEVGEMAPSTQVKLLRVLQQREVIPVGATEAIPVDVRLIAATNRHLERDIDEGRFRRDLFYRLNVITIELPPLRDRYEDVQLLAEYFLAGQAEGDPKGAKKLSSKALTVLQGYHWPGNVRELENVIERAVVLTAGATIKPEAMPSRLREAPPEPLVQDRPPLNPALDIIERAYIEHVLRAEAGNKTRAAEVLGIDPSTLYRKIKRYDLDG